MDSHGISRVPRYSGTCREPAACRLRGSHPLWPIVPDRSTTPLIGNSLVLHQTGPTTPPCKHDGLGYVRVRSPLLAESLLFSFPPGTEMVHFPGLSSPPYGFRWRYSGISLSGLPHSEILGSKPVCGSPKLFAAYHVLHRLLAPRHSPYALSSLTIRNSRLTSAAPRRYLRQSLAHCVCEPPALAGAVATGSTLASEDRICGRKKLPFAGYSVVKESVEAFSCRLSAASHWSAACAASFSPNFWPVSLMHACLLRAPCHWPELVIVTSPTPECKLMCNLFVPSSRLNDLARSAFALRATARQPSLSRSAPAGWPAEPKPASA